MSTTTDPTTTDTTKVEEEDAQQQQQQQNELNTSDIPNENNKREREPEVTQANKKRKTDLLAQLKQTVNNANTVLGKETKSKQSNAAASATTQVKKSQRTRKPNTKYEDDVTTTATTTPLAASQGSTMDIHHHKMCAKVLSTIKGHRWAWPFNQPVDPEKLGIPDYFQIIKNPMDLGTVEKKLNNDEYADIQAFAADVRLVWANCMHYNQPGSDVVRMAETLRDLFESKFQKMEKHINGGPKATGTATDSTDTSKPTTTPRRTSKSSSGSASKPKGGRKKSSSGPEINLAGTDSRPMSYDEMKNLSTQIEQLTSQDLAKVVNIIRSRAPKASSQASNSEIEIDLDALDAVTLRILETFVTDCMKLRRERAEARSRAAEKAAETRRLNRLKKEQAAASAESEGTAANSEQAAHESGSDTQESGDDTDSDTSDSDSDSESDSENNIQSLTAAKSEEQSATNAQSSTTTTAGK